METGSGPAVAQRISLVRDAEIENTIRQFATPVFRAANLNPDAISVHLVQDDRLNAFVAGGQRLFINTGLLMKAKRPEQVIGVIAHETGHIAGGHLARFSDALKGSTAATILSMVLGGIAIGAGRGDVGSAIIQGGQNIAARSFLSYSRTQESSADQAGMKFLDEIGLSSRGLMEFMQTLSGQEYLDPERQDPYVRTHPLTRERIDTIANHVKNTPGLSDAASHEIEVMFGRMKAKLIGYLRPFEVTLRLYPEQNNSLYARYARAFAYFRHADIDKALPLIDGLIAEHPKDPYFHELKGQMLFDNGNAKDALEPYQTAVDLLPKVAILRIDLARVQLALGGHEMLQAAVENLRWGLSRERESPFAWRQLAIAYGRLDDKPHSSLALAEEALLLGRKSDARYHAGLAEKVFKRGSREWLQAQDILIAARPPKQRQEQ